MVINELSSTKKPYRVVAQLTYVLKILNYDSGARVRKLEVFI